AAALGEELEERLEDLRDLHAAACAAAKRALHVVAAEVRRAEIEVPHQEARPADESARDLEQPRAVRRERRVGFEQRAGLLVDRLRRGRALREAVLRELLEPLGRIRLAA